MTIITVETPFGDATIDLRGETVWLRDELHPHAAIYAAKECGATRVIELVSARTVSHLLRGGDLVVPHDIVDLTLGRRSTFFVNKGYGFIGQNPFFCEDVRTFLLSAAHTTQRRVFSRGVLAVSEGMGVGLETAKGWNTQLDARSVAPAAYLAKELELCYAALCVIEASIPEMERQLQLPEEARAAHQAQLMDQVAADLEIVTLKLPEARTCPCASAMAATRQRGLIGDDWRTWVGAPE